VELRGVVRPRGPRVPHLGVPGKLALPEQPMAGAGVAVWVGLSRLGRASIVPDRTVVSPSRIVSVGKRSTSLIVPSSVAVVGPRRQVTVTPGSGLSRDEANGDIC